MWVLGFDPSSSLKIQIVATFVGCLAIVSTFFLFRWVDRRALALETKAKSDSNTVHSLSGAMTVGNTGTIRDINLIDNSIHQHTIESPKGSTDHELEEINDFICKKDEIELRTTFDFPDVLKYNIKFVRRNLAPALVSQEESVEIDAFFLNGNSMFDVKYANVTTPNNRVQIDWIPGKIGIINLSAKYVENKKALTKLFSSSRLPADVVAALKGFNEAVDRDSTLMIESLNQSLASDPRNILENDVYGSNWYGSAAGFYWKQFISLRAKADLVSVATRNAMDKTYARR
jgi:hypothetical protein